MRCIVLSYLFLALSIDIQLHPCPETIAVTITHHSSTSDLRANRTTFLVPVASTTLSTHGPVSKTCFSSLTTENAVSATVPNVVTTGIDTGFSSASTAQIPPVIKDSSPFVTSSVTRAGGSPILWGPSLALLGNFLLSI